MPKSLVTGNLSEPGKPSLKKNPKKQLWNAYEMLCMVSVNWGFGAEISQVWKLLNNSWSCFYVEDFETLLEKRILLSYPMFFFTTLKLFISSHIHFKMVFSTWINSKENTAFSVDFFAGRTDFLLPIKSGEAIELCESQ